MSAYSQKLQESDSIQSDMHIAAVFLQINNLDISNARLIRHSAVTGAVKEISEMILVEHVPIRDEFLALLNRLGIEPDLPDSYSRYWNEKTFRKMLKSASSHDGDKLYIDYEYTFSKKAVTLIENRLIPACNNERLKLFLVSNLPKLKAHLSHIAMYHNGQGTKRKMGMMHGHP